MDHRQSQKIQYPKGTSNSETEPEIETAKKEELTKEDDIHINHQGEDFPRPSRRLSNLPRAPTPSLSAKQANWMKRRHRCLEEVIDDEEEEGGEAGQHEESTRVSDDQPDEEQGEAATEEKDPKDDEAGAACGFGEAKQSPSY